MNTVPNTPQPHDVNDTGLAIGQYVDVPGVGMCATIIRINNETIWLTYDDGIDGCVAVADVQIVHEGEDPYDSTKYDAWNDEQSRQIEAHLDALEDEREENTFFRDSGFYPGDFIDLKY